MADLPRMQGLKNCVVENRRIRVGPGNDTRHDLSCRQTFGGKLSPVLDPNILGGGAVF